MNPSIVDAQMQGGIVHGLTAALRGRMSFSGGVANAWAKLTGVRKRSLPLR